MVGVTLIITLLPFRFARPESWRVLLYGNALDLVANVLLFVPLGFLYQLAASHFARHSALRVLAVGSVISSAIEVAQLFEVERYSTVADVFANAVGAGLGAWLSMVASRRLSSGEQVVGRLSLELPLMGLIYLLIPLLWLGALASGGDALHAWPSILLAVFGGSILGGLQRHHFGPDRRVRLRNAVGSAVVWYVAGTFPLVSQHLAVVLTGAAIAGALAYWRATHAAGDARIDRRYEVPVLLAAAPAFGVYLVMLSVTPIVGGVGAWVMGLGFPGVATEWTKTEILRLLECVAAFTLLGYMVAEHRGRVLTRFRLVVPRLLTVVSATSVIGEGLRGFHAAHGASLARLLLLVVAGLYGGWLYHLQRRHVLALIRPESRTE